MPTIAVRKAGPATGAIPQISSPRPQIAQTPTPAATAVAVDADAGSNKLAKVSMALVVILGALISPITLIMAFIARAQIKRSGQGGADVAIAALVVSGFFLGIGVLSVALLRFGAI